MRFGGSVALLLPLIQMLTTQPSRKTVKEQFAKKDCPALVAAGGSHRTAPEGTPVTKQGE